VPASGRSRRAVCAGQRPQVIGGRARGPRSTTRRALRRSSASASSPPARSSRRSRIGDSPTVFESNGQRIGTGSPWPSRPAAAGGALAQARHDQATLSLPRRPARRCRRAVARPRDPGPCTRTRPPPRRGTTGVPHRPQPPSSRSTIGQARSKPRPDRRDPGDRGRRRSTRVSCSRGSTTRLWMRAVAAAEASCARQGALPAGPPRARPTSPRARRRRRAAAAARHRDTEHARSDQLGKGRPSPPRWSTPTTPRPGSRRPRPRRRGALPVARQGARAPSSRRRGAAVTLARPSSTPPRSCSTHPPRRPHRRRESCGARPRSSALSRLNTPIPVAVHGRPPASSRSREIDEADVPAVTGQGRLRHRRMPTATAGSRSWSPRLTGELGRKTGATTIRAPRVDYPRARAVIARLRRRAGHRAGRSACASAPRRAIGRVTGCRARRRQARSAAARSAGLEQREHVARRREPRARRRLARATTAADECAIGDARIPVSSDASVRPHCPARRPLTNGDRGGSAGRERGELTLGCRGGASGELARWRSSSEAPRLGVQDRPRTTQPATNPGGRAALFR